MYYFGTVAYVATIALFVYFTNTSYQSAISQPFIAITVNAGDCQTVPIAVTNSFMADDQGNWIGSPDFVYSFAPYSISFNNFQVSTNDQYSAMMLAFEKGLETVGAIATTQNLPQNLMFWMSYVQYYSVDFPTATNFSSIGHGQLQYLQMTGDPSQVFDLSYTQGHLMNQNGYCGIDSYASFDQANAMLSADLNYTEFIHTSTCNTIVNPLSFGYFPTVDQNNFLLSLDVLSFSTAMAVNLGILLIADLGIASSSFYEFEFQNTTYLTGQYFDTRYPSMNTIVCIQNMTAFPAGSKGVQAMCMYLLGQTLALPVFNHFGQSKVEPVYCDCATNGKSDECQSFNLLSGLVFYPAAPQTSSTTSALSILQNTGVFDLVRAVVKYPTYAEFNRAAFNASWAAAAPAYGQEASYISTTSWRRNAYKFCALAPSSVCSVMVFNSLDGTSKKVSSYKYQLTNGSCYNSLSIDSVYW
jgi:hypothetical protein